jgi:predicted ATPase/class 3 adenylate cyclase
LNAAQTQEPGRALPDGDLTMLFTDIEGSTQLLHELGDLYGDVLAEHHRVLREVWPAHGGMEIHADGDAFLVAFREARAAVRAASAAQSALASNLWPHDGEVRVRMGLHTGNVRIRHDDFWGIDVHYAARLCSAAHGGQVLLSATTRALVGDVAAEDLGEHALKDFPAARKLYHLSLPGRTSADFAPPRTLETVRTNLPSVSTRLVGRNRELEFLRDRLESGARLVTITGVGGSGKSRLALECGAALVASFRDGVFLAGLASITGEDKVAFAIANAVGAPCDDGRGPEALLAEHLARRELLLIVDNMEHLLGTASLMPRLLEASPGLRILATSQAPLHVRGELVMPLDSLAVPLEGEHDATAMERVPAVALFVERARAADPTFELSADTAPAVAELCRRLDGLPLALELAAARVRLGGPQRLLAGLERGIDSLGSGGRDLPERQRGLRAALDWTVSLLGDEERALFAGLGAFAEAWTLDQLDWMFGAEFDVWEASAALMDFSLIRTRGDGRFTMAEAVRTYAKALLDEQGRADHCHARHAAMLTEDAEAIYNDALLDVSAQIARTLDLMREFAAALRWTAVHDPAAYRRLLAALGMSYYLSGNLSVLAEDLLALAAGDERDDDVSARVCMSESLVYAAKGDNRSSVLAARRSVERCRQLGDHSGEALALIREAHMLTFLAPDDVARGRELLDAALALPPVQADRRLQEYVQGEIAINLYAAGALDDAEPILREIVADPGRTDWASDAASSYLGDCEMRRGRYAEALPHYVDALRRLRGTQLHNALIQCDSVSIALAGLGRDAEAIELRAATQAVGDRDGTVGLPEPDELIPDGPELLAASRARLRDAAAAEAERRGRARDLDDLVSWVASLAAPVAVG